MTLNLEAMQSIFPNRLWLPIPTDQLPSVPEAAYASGYQNACLNQVCLQAFLNEAQETTDHLPTPWPNQEAQANIWEFLNGTAITLGQHRIVLIPSEALDTEELVVPQEWVDIPHWSADYYVAAQVNADQGWVQFWGYTSHQNLKGRATFDPIYRHYEIDRDFMVMDMDLLWVGLSMGLIERAEVSPLPKMLTEEMPSLITQLAQPQPYSPRLEVEFPQWAAIISQDQWRQQLYQQRLNPRSRLADMEQIIAEGQQTLVNAALWLQDQVDQVAQDLQWQLMSALRMEPVGLRDASQELELILANLARRGLDIPAVARSIEYDQPIMDQMMKLYLVVWPVITSQSIPEWYLLVVISGTEDYPLLPDTTLVIRDDQETLVEVTLEEDSPNQYLVGSVSGNWTETFQAIITRPDGASVTLPPIAYQPEPG